MDRERNIISDFWDFAEYTDNKRLLRFLNRDRLSGIYVFDETRRWYVNEIIPKYVRTEIEKWLNESGYKYLY